jgi:hypothetical protein
MLVNLAFRSQKRAQRTDRANLHHIMIQNGYGEYREDIVENPPGFFTSFLFPIYITGAGLPLNCNQRLGRCRT